MNTRNLFYALGLAILLSVGAPANAQTSAGTNESFDGWPKPRPLGSAIPVYRPMEGSGEEQEAVDEPKTGSTLTLRQALVLALMKSPELASFSWEVRAADARILQADLPPNPEIGAEVENFGGAGSRRGFGGSEFTLALNQLVELGGKREKRVRVATLEKELAGWDYEAKRLEVYVETAKAFTEALAAQQLLELKRSLFDLASRVRTAVRDRVNAGRASSIEDTKAAVELEGRRLEMNRAEKRFQAARDTLAASWGAETARFIRVEGDLLDVPALPSMAQMVGRLPDNPDLAGAETRYELRRSQLSLERARDIPDVTISAGVRRYQETDDSAFLVGFSIPIPVFGPNTGNVLEAERRLPQERYRRRSTITDLTATLKRKYAEATALRTELIALGEKIIPGARTAFDASQQGYRQGKFDFLEVLDAQRTLFAARERHIETAADFHNARLDLERLTGREVTSPDFETR